jgi:hypothetical protein
MFVILQQWEGQQDQTMMMEHDDEQELRRTFFALVQDAKESNTKVTYFFKEIKGISQRNENTFIEQAKNRGATKIVQIGGKLYDDTNLPDQL